MPDLRALLLVTVVTAGGERRRPAARTVVSRGMASGAGPLRDARPVMSGYA